MRAPPWSGFGRMSKYFQRGVPSDGNGGGRPAGSRNKLQARFLADLLADYETHGAGAIKICRVEKPVEYLKIIASILPKELIVDQGVLVDLSDEELSSYVGLLQRMQMAKLPAEESEATAADETTKH